MDPFEGCAPVGLEEVLRAREERMHTQKKLLAEWGGALICLTLVIPGEYKWFPLARQAFGQGVELVLERLRKEGISPRHRLLRNKNTGPEGYFCLREPVCVVKKLMMELEDSHPLGRLLDLDVMDRDGGVSRRDLGRGERRCLICGGPVWICSRSRAHPVEELQQRTVELLESCLREATPQSGPLPSGCCACGPEALR